MSVYFAASGDYMKIGYSANVIQRMASLPNDYSKRPAALSKPSPIELVGWFPGTKRDELLAHAALNDFWETGEWYEDNETVRAYLADQPDVLLVAEVSAAAMFAVIRGASVDEAKATYPLNTRPVHELVNLKGLGA